MDEITVPIYLITGFLESGKTSFLSFTLQQDYFRTEGKTLLILCEEGEEEYDEEALAKDNVVVEVIEKEEDFTPERLQALDIIHQPERVVMEYNGMWLVSKFEEMKLPAGWGIEQHITCVDASTFQVYMQNMKSIFMDMVRNADMVVFNRSKKEYPLANFRRSIKVVNPSAEVIFEDEEGEMTDIFADQMPFDLDAEIVDIPPEDYGIWFVDAMDHPDRYMGKEIRFTARYCASAKPDQKYFVPGRHIMTCCEDDIQFLGFICYFEGDMPFKHGDWVNVSVHFDYGECRMYGEEGPILRLIHIEEGKKPQQELVTFT